LLLQAGYANLPYSSLESVIERSIVVRWLSAAIWTGKAADAARGTRYERR
jgi:hypothetical protein